MSGHLTRQDMQDTSMNRWKKYPNFDRIVHFSPREFHCKCTECKNRRGAENVQYKLLAALDDMRHIIGQPIIVTSGYRCAKHSRERSKTTPGGHHRGTAVDISMWDAGMRHLYIEWIMRNNQFQRIGVAKNFLHLQITDKQQPLEALWSYRR